MPTGFVIKCTCGTGSLSFRSTQGYSEQVIDTLHCPQCADQAAPEAVIVRITKPAEKVGLWAIKVNQAILDEQGPQTSPLAALRTRKIIIEDEPDAEILGLKDQELPEGKPSKLPKKTLRRGEESPHPLHQG